MERLNGYISLYRDLGLEEEDSNYHSGDCEEDEYEEDEVLSHDEVRIELRCVKSLEKCVLDIIAQYPYQF